MLGPHLVQRQRRRSQERCRWHPWPTA